MKKLSAVIISVMLVLVPLTVSAGRLSENKISLTDILESVKNYKKISKTVPDAECPVKITVGKNLKNVIFGIIEKENTCEDCENTEKITVATGDLLKNLFEKLVKITPETEKEESEDISEETPEEQPEEPAFEPEWREKEPEIVWTEPQKPEDEPEIPVYEEKEKLYENENDYVNEVLRLVNKYRNESGLASVKLDEKLCEAAQIRAKETKTSFSHTRPSGKSCFSVLSDLGISYMGAGENIAYGQNSPDEVMNAWMNSEGHRANILNSSFTKLGVGVYTSSGVIYWAQMFTY